MANTKNAYIDDETIQKQIKKGTIDKIKIQHFCLFCYYIICFNKINKIAARNYENGIHVRQRNQKLLSNASLLRIQSQSDQFKYDGC